MFILVFLTVHLHARPISVSQQIHELIRAVSSDSISKHLDQLCWANGHQSRVTYTPGNYFAAEYIAQYLESLPGIHSVQRDTFYMQYATSPYHTWPLINIVATLPGKAQEPKTIILGAHYDASASREGGSSYYSAHWETLRAQGADDNASGVAAMLEIARILSDPSRLFEPDENLVFIAFAAEEYHPGHPNYHHLGSLYDAEKRKKTNAPLQAALILDMIAYNPNTDYIEVISNEASLWLADKVYESAQNYIDSLILNETPVDVPYSDHESYQQYGFSSILLMENDSPWNDDLPFYTSNPYYHKTTDKIETLNFSLLEKVTQLALATLAELSQNQPAYIFDTDPAFSASKPSDFHLKTYPNPFNYSTQITFQLNEPGPVTIEIFDLGGKKVDVLCQNDYFTAGTHKISWNARENASGLYLMAIRSTGKTYYSKLTLIR